jgi:hypothetical protein
VKLIGDFIVNIVADIIIMANVQDSELPIGAKTAILKDWLHFEIKS